MKAIFYGFLYCVDWLKNVLGWTVTLSLIYLLVSSWMSLWSLLQFKRQLNTSQIFILNCEKTRFKFRLLLVTFLQVNTSWSFVSFFFVFSSLAVDVVVEKKIDIILFCVFYTEIEHQTGWFVFLAAFVKTRTIILLFGRKKCCINFFCNLLSL